MRFDGDYECEHGHYFQKQNISEPTNRTRVSAGGARSHDFAVNCLEIYRRPEAEQSLAYQRREQKGIGVKK